MTIAILYSAMQAKAAYLVKLQDRYLSNRQYGLTSPGQNLNRDILQLKLIEIVYRFNKYRKDEQKVVFPSGIDKSQFNTMIKNLKTA